MAESEFLVGHRDWIHFSMTRTTALAIRHSTHEIVSERVWIDAFDRGKQITPVLMSSYMRGGRVHSQGATTVVAFVELRKLN